MILEGLCEAMELSPVDNYLFPGSIETSVAIRI